MRTSVIPIVIASLFGLAGFAGAQQNTDFRKELDALKQGQEDIQREIGLEDKIEKLQKGQEAMQRQLDEIKTLLQARPAAAPAQPAGPVVAGMEFDISANPIKGKANAPLTLVEFTDYQCPFCSRFTANTLPDIVKNYIDTGKVRLALVDMPLESIHKNAFKASEAALCARDQGKFWEMHDRLFANQQTLDSWKDHAAAVSLDVAKFESCLGSGSHTKTIRDNIAMAQKAGASGTPSFVLAKTDPANPNKVTGITFLKGAQAFSAFQTAIDGALGGGQ